MQQRSIIISLLAALISLSRLPTCFAADVWPTEILANDLSEPSGLAIQPSTETLFVGEAGTGKILAFPKDKPDARYIALQGFAKAEKLKDGNPEQRGGLAALRFLDEQNLAVAYTKSNRQPAVSVFELPAQDDANKMPVSADAAKQTFGPAHSESKEKGAAEPAGIGSFFGMAVSPFNPPALFITNPGSSRGWLFKADIRNRSSLEELKPFMMTKMAPLAITMNRRGVLVVSANSIATKEAPEGTLAFYNWKSGAMIASFPMPLADVVSLAYSPESGRLYAATLSRAKPNEAGVYRLDAATVDGRAGMQVVKVAAVDRPSALAFTVANTLFVASMGSVNEKSGSSGKGMLLKITGDL